MVLINGQIGNRMQSNKSGFVFPAEVKRESLGLHQKGAKKMLRSDSWSFCMAFKKLGKAILGTEIVDQ